MYSDFTSAMTTFYMAYCATFYTTMLAFSVVAYIFVGKSLSAIARRRGINRPWLAWVPVGSDWMLGCISDQFRYVSYGEQTNRRGKLLWYNIGLLICLVITCIFTTLMVVLEMTGGSAEVILILALLLLIPCFAMIPLAVIYSINYYKSCYDLFRSCDPGKSLVYLLVSIFTSVTVPFFLFACRNQDLGMPPRREPESLPETE